jgi:dipeptidyl aminopeptidase/acylaminoacyl peptidase
MRFAFALAAATSFGLTLAPTLAAEPLQTSPLQIEAIAEHPAISGLVLSPDGKHMAGLVGTKQHKWPVISIWEVDNLSKPPVWIPSDRMRPRNVAFLGNDRLLFFADQPFTYGSLRTFTVQAIVTDVQGRTFEQPFATKGTLSDLAREAEKFGVNFSIFQDGSIANPTRYLIARENIDLGTTEILGLDTKTMQVERAARAANTENFVLADIRDGQLMVKQTIRSTGGGWQVVFEIRNRASGSWEEHPALGYPIKERYTVNPIGFFDADPNKLYISTNRNSNFTQIRIYDIATRTWEAEPAFASPDFDIVDVLGHYDREAKTLTGALAYTIDGPARKTVFVDDYWAAIQKTLDNQFRGSNVTLTSRNKRLGRAIVTVSGPRQPPAYFILFNGKELKLIGKSRPTMDERTFGDTVYVTYKARDGMTIPGLLTLPAGYNKARHGPIPAVIHPHGGPWARDYITWDSSGWTQFLTTRGYAVLQPQYRGSDGWGMALWKAGDQQWGLKMQDDKDDGAAWLVQQGIADPKRIAIFGYSYGGFAAVAASVRPNSPYQCAIAGAPVADLQRLGNLWGANRIQRELQGWTVTGMDPIRNVDKGSIPILLYHGDRDRQADTVHSQLFYSAMKSAGKDAEYVEIKDMWHQLPWWPEWHRQSLSLIENYLKGPKCFGDKITVTAPR